MIGLSKKSRLGIDAMEGPSRRHKADVLIWSYGTARSRLDKAERERLKAKKKQKKQGKRDRS